jgi:hypothetical protein
VGKEAQDIKGSLNGLDSHFIDQGSIIWNIGHNTLGKTIMSRIKVKAGK